MVLWELKGVAVQNRTYPTLLEAWIRLHRTNHPIQADGSDIYLAMALTISCGKSRILRRLCLGIAGREKCSRGGQNYLQNICDFAPASFRGRWFSPARGICFCPLSAERGSVGSDVGLRGLPQDGWLSAQPPRRSSQEVIQHWRFKCAGVPGRARDSGASMMETVLTPSDSGRRGWRRGKHIRHRCIHANPLANNIPDKMHQCVAACIILVNRKSP